MLEVSQDIYSSWVLNHNLTTRVGTTLTFPPKSKSILRGQRYLKIKRVLDLLLGTCLLIGILPIILLCAIVIRIDSAGPVFFAQYRTGRGGKRFKMYKLRTMVKDAEIRKKEVMHLNRHKSSIDFKAENDPRITRVGRILRKTSLDELPQIFNVLKGDMSLIGPRPTSFPSATYHLWQTARLDILPGITGLWQVSGRSEIDFDDRSRLDIYYAQNFSLFLDIKILFKTFGAVLRAEGAE
ncbi:MAG: hypothetical protein Kow0037_25580 [Calditrichia bacterium]